MTQVQPIRSQVSDDDLFIRRIADFAADTDGRQIRILEAGCGLGEMPALDGIDCHVTGVDYEHPVLRARTERRRDLDVWMLGDLRTLPLPHRSFDVVHSSRLLQRVRNAELVLDRVVAALRPGGLFLLRTTDRDSAYGFCVRLLPMWARTLYWRWAVRRRDGQRRPLAVSPSYPPLPVAYEPLASHSGIQRYCLMRGLVVMEEYAEDHSLERFGRLARAAAWVLRAVAVLSRGRLSSDRSALVFVIRKPENRFARVLPGPYDNPYDAA